MNRCQLAIEAAKAGGELLRRHWGRLTSIQSKGEVSDLVTEADLASEKEVLRILQEGCPEDAILAEESGESTHQSKNRWVIDPLDGTTNYAHCIPHVAVSIGFTFDDRSEIGVVYNPILEELFVAERGKGCTLNGEPIRVSETSSLNQSLLATGFAYDRKICDDPNYAAFCRLTHISRGVRRLGSAALDLAYVAAGRFDGFWEKGLSPWDLAAGVLLVEEAGGRVTDLDGAPFVLSSGRCIACNQNLYEPLREEVREARALRRDHEESEFIFTREAAIE